MWPPSDWSIRTSSCTPFSKSFTTMILSAKMASRYLQQMMRHTPYYLNDDKKVIPVSQNHGEDSYGNSWKPCCKVNIKNHSRNQFSSLIFQSWEKNDDPAEQEGKGVAIKSCTQFFTWLKEVEHPSISSDVPFFNYFWCSFFPFFCFRRRRRRKISRLWLLRRYLQEIFCTT